MSHQPHRCEECGEIIDEDLNTCTSCRVQIGVDDGETTNLFFKERIMSVQSVELSIKTVEDMLQCMRRNKRPVKIDFVNRTIIVLSEQKEDDKGRVYQDYLGMYDEGGFWVG